MVQGRGGRNVKIEVDGVDITDHVDLSTLKIAEATYNSADGCRGRWDESKEPISHGQMTAAQLGDLCLNCGNTDLTPIHGCWRCEKCGWKADCSG